MRKYIIFLNLIAVFVGRLAFAKEAKVGYVNIKYLLENYETAQSAQRALDLEVMRYKAIADSLKRTYEALEGALASQRLILSEEAIRAKELEIAEAKRRYDTYIEEVWGRGGKFERKNRELIAPIMQEVKDVCSELAKKEGFALILDISQTPVVYAQSGLDLTEKVLTMLKERAGVISSKTGKTPTTKIDTISTTSQEISIGVFPFFNENQESQQENIGSQIQQTIIDIIKTFPQVRVIAKSEINNLLLSRNISLGSEIKESDAYSMGLMLNAQYLVLGKSRKEGNLIHINLKVLSPLRNEVLFETEIEVSRKELLKQELGETIRRFIKNIEK
ncbi:MAG: OmpH family outer membrane protein [candidate division WOR-3 bacterium]|nr:OmpH family outer membrane protein [candidate division WOR-3 bacterium]MDW7987524.1 OmpH family outer membrane protein [candidate division WOR-3 bacterium]